MSATRSAAVQQRRIKKDLRHDESLLRIAELDRAEPPLRDRVPSHREPAAFPAVNGTPYIHSPYGEQDEECEHKVGQGTVLPSYEMFPGFPEIRFALHPPMPTLPPPSASTGCTVVRYL